MCVYVECKLTKLIGTQGNTDTCKFGYLNTPLKYISCNIILKKRATKVVPKMERKNIIKIIVYRKSTNL